MSNIFISYRFTGEDKNQLEFVLGGMWNSLQEAGHIVTCSFYYEDIFRQQAFTPDQIYDHMLERQRESDVFMALVKTSEKSKGMSMESAKAKELRQRYVLAVKEGLHVPEFSEVADEILTYQDFPDLFEILRSFR